MNSTQSVTRLAPSGVLLLVVAVLAGGCSPKEQESVVATVGPEKITLSEYEKLYVKSNGSWEQGAAASQEDREKFLDLIIKYRLKLADAYKEGLQNKPEVRTEIQQYKGSLAASFTTEREIISPGLHHLYTMRNEEIRASHILISLSPTSSSTDSLNAYKKAYEIITEAKSGGDFGDLAVTYSADPSVKQNRGDLYYFTAGQMVLPFEDAVYALKAGEISSIPVRTQYGLHIIKVFDRKPAAGEIHCSHIMIRFNNQAPSPEDTLAGYKKIKALQDSLALGIDFAELAKRNSGDGGSATHGGDLGWFARRRWVQPFDEVAFTLKPGQISGIVRTIYGYHLIKCYEAKPPKSFEESKQDLQSVYQQLRFQEDHNKYVAKVKKEVGYVQNDSVVAKFIAACDTGKSISDSAWTSGITRSLGRSTIMSFGGRPVSVDSIVAIVASHPDLSNVPLRPATLHSAIDKAAEQLSFAAKAELLEQDTPEFASILKEYKEGILLYQIEQNRVWGKVVTSDSLQHLYFEQNRDRFTYPNRDAFTAVRMPSEVAGWNLYQKMRSGASLESIAAADSSRMRLPLWFQFSFTKGSTTLTRLTMKVLSDIAAQMKADTVLKLQITARVDTSSHKTALRKLADQRLSAMRSYLTGKLAVPGHRISSMPLPQAPPTARSADTLAAQITGRQPLLLGNPEKNLLAPGSDDRAKRADSLQIGEFTTPFFAKDAFTIMRLDAREPARQKTFEEAGAEVATAYQDYESKRLETEWLSGLRQQFPVVENKQVLKNAFAPHK